MQSACWPGVCLVTAEMGYDSGNLLCKPVIEIGMTLMTAVLNIPVSAGCSFKQRNKNFTLDLDLARTFPLL